MRYIYHDGGRALAGFKGLTGDCACRALAIAVPLPYQDAYELINAESAFERTGQRKRSRSSAREGVYHRTMRRIMERVGWTWTPTMGIGTGCTVHMRAAELPAGRLIVSLSRHYAAVVDGVVYDSHDPCRGGTRCVYGYWQPGKDSQ